MTDYWTCKTCTYAVSTPLDGLTPNKVEQHEEETGHQMDLETED